MILSKFDVTYHFQLRTIIQKYLKNFNIIQCNLDIIIFHIYQVLINGISIAYVYTKKFARKKFRLCLFRPPTYNTKVKKSTYIFQICTDEIVINHIPTTYMLIKSVVIYIMTQNLMYIII